MWSAGLAAVPAAAGRELDGMDARQDLAELARDHRRAPSRRADRAGACGRSPCRRRGASRRPRPSPSWGVQLEQHLRRARRAVKAAAQHAELGGAVHGRCSRPALPRLAPRRRRIAAQDQARGACRPPPHRSSRSGARRRRIAGSGPSMRAAPAEVAPAASARPAATAVGFRGLCERSFTGTVAQAPPAW